MQNNTKEPLDTHGNNRTLPRASLQGGGDSTSCLERKNPSHSCLRDSSLPRKSSPVFRCFRAESYKQVEKTQHCHPRGISSCNLPSLAAITSFLSNFKCYSTESTADHNSILAIVLISPRRVTFLQIREIVGNRRLPSQCKLTVPYINSAQQIQNHSELPDFLAALDVSHLGITK